MNLRLKLPVEAGSASSARAAIDALDDFIDSRVIGDVQLLVSELVTNSFRHSGLGDDGWIGLELSVEPSKLRIEVVDPGCGFDKNLVGPDLQTEGGWGLLLVKRLARRWGVSGNGFTKVWFEMDPRAASIAS